MEIYAPLAGRMGMQDMREELEELAFRNINPEAYGRSPSGWRRSSSATKGVIAGIEKALAVRAVREATASRRAVKSRQKKPWSVFRKMEAKALSFEQLSDIFGFRVVVDAVEDCYRALGAIHTTWSMVPGRFKDYISTPKQNDYRSIHTTIVGPSRQRIELQIRTRDMDRIAEYGVAAHALFDLQGCAGKANGAALKRSRARPTPMPGCAAPSSSSPRATIRRISSRTPSSSCSRTRSSASRRRAC